MTTLRSRHAEVAQTWARRYIVASHEATARGHHIQSIELDHTADALLAIAEERLTYEDTLAELAHEEQYILDQPVRDHGWLNEVRKTIRVIHELRQEAIEEKL